MAELKADSMFAIPGRTAVISGGGELCTNEQLRMKILNDDRGRSR